MRNLKKWLTDFRKKNSKFEETWYDLEYDRELIIQSISKQYHILPSEQEELHYSDWISLVAGLMHDTPLGQVVRIRSEKDKNMLKSFGAYENKLRSEWFEFRSRHTAQTATEQDKLDVANYFYNMFANMFGGGKK